MDELINYCMIYAFDARPICKERKTRDVLARTSRVLVLTSFFCLKMKLVTAETPGHVVLRDTIL